ncbi:MAG: hypothetical protein HN348_30465, partial [Proteobacteria bacterium]|nr:hypothetical protein [Pseudomonadota bacterium]
GIACRVTANDGYLDSTTEEVNAVVNTLPIVNPSLDNYYVAANGTLTCTPNGSDVDNQALTYSYTWQAGPPDGIWMPFATDTGDSSTIDMANNGIQRGYFIACFVTANDGLEDSYRGYAGGALNILPVVTPTIDQDYAPTTGTLTCSPNGYDAEYHNMTYSYKWIDETGAVIANATGDSSTIDMATHSLSEGETVTCRVDVHDGLEDGLQAEASAQVNRRPTVAPSLDHDIVATTGSLTCTPHGADGDGHGLTYSYEWVESTGAVFATATGATSTINISAYPGSLSEGETVTCRVVANDGVEDGPSAEISAKVNNRPVVAPFLDSYWVATSGTLICTPNGTDADNHGLTYSYQWVESTGAVIAYDSGATSILYVSTYYGSSLSAGEIVTCRVVANDGLDNGISGEANGQVNNPPTATATVAAVNDFQDAVCTPATNDVNGHGVTPYYRWTVNGGGNHTGSTLSKSNFSAGDTLQCLITPNDGYEDGVETASNTVMATFERTFTYCGKTGCEGPSQGQCDGSYANTALNGEVTVTAGYQYWHVPFTGTFNISVRGARGGGTAGGNGALMSGDFDLTAG